MAKKKLCKHGKEHFCGFCNAEDQPRCAHGNAFFCGFCLGETMRSWMDDDQTKDLGEPRAKIVHRAAVIAHDGRVSARCYKKPRAIDLRVVSWTIRDEAVTCTKCKRIVQGGKP